MCDVQHTLCTPNHTTHVHLIPSTYTPPQLSCRLLDKEELIQQMTTVYGLTNEYIVNCIHKMEIKLHHQLVKQARKENIVFKDEILNASSLPEGLPCSSAVEARRITPGSASALLRPGTVGQMGLFAREHIRPFTILGSYQGGAVGLGVSW